MPCRDSASLQVRANAICPTAAAAWLSSSLSGPDGSLSTARPSAIAPDETIRRSRPSRCNAARSALNDASHVSRSPPARRSTSKEDPTFTTTRRKSASVGMFMTEYRNFKRERARSGSALHLRFVLQLRFVLKAIIAGKTAHQLAPFPIVENAADIFAGDAGHGGDVALADFLPDHHAARADILAEMIRQFEQGRRHAALERQKTSGGDHGVGFAQSRRQERHQRFVDLRPPLRERLECGTAEKTQGRIAHRHHRGRTRQPVDHRQLADDRAWAHESQNTLGAGARHHAHFEQTVIDPIAAVARIAGEEKHLVGFEAYRLGTCKQIRRKMSGQSREQAWTRPGGFLQHKPQPPSAQPTAPKHEQLRAAIKSPPGGCRAGLVDPRKGPGWGLGTEFHPLSSPPAVGGSGGDARLSAANQVSC